MEVFRYLKAALTRNWWLKLVALTLAIAVYYTIKSADNPRENKANHDRTLFQEKR